MKRRDIIKFLAVFTTTIFLKAFILLEPTISKSEKMGGIIVLSLINLFAIYQIYIVRENTRFIEEDNPPFGDLPYVRGENPKCPECLEELSYRGDALYQCMKCKNVHWRYD